MSETQILGLRNEDGSGAAGVSMSRETAAEPVTSLHEVWRKELSSAVSLQRLWWRWRGGYYCERRPGSGSRRVLALSLQACVSDCTCVCVRAENINKGRKWFTLFICIVRVGGAAERERWRRRWHQSPEESELSQRLMPVGSEHDPCVDTGRQSGDIRTVIPL